MTLRMLVDALHEEETRVVIADDNHVIDFDIESSTKRQVKGNIYLAKVTRVEPSLQAAFVEYGAGRQGFLPFSEIHPDYYQIPIADKKELLAAQAAERKAEQRKEEAELEKEEARQQDNAESDSEGQDEITDIVHDENAVTAEAQSFDQPAIVSETIIETGPDGEQGEVSKEVNAEITEVHEEKTMEDVGGDDAYERPKRQAVRRYKIQEVIKKNQVMLIQVIKEERGNKGASVTTYISLPGRYCVLMPNTAHGGGVSRKINDAKERRKLKELLEGLDLNDGMSLIIRTAGLGHSKADIARDYSYLIRLWNKIRELTLTSSAPSLVYEEGNVIKRSIRDFFNNDVDEVVIAGEKAMETAQEFVRMLLPTQIDKVSAHNDILPIFQKYGVERHLSSMYDSTVVMRSGGYLVINPTEALISIDINSGRATGERNVEDTATRINIEAAHEIARQLRLRDLAGLIVIDFIDMMDSRHRRAVERALKDALKADRAKIQVGRISPFGLLEMSRQRLRPSLNEIQMIECPTCKGAGHIRSYDSAMLQIMRAIESEIALADFDNFDPVRVHVATSAELAVHFLNGKRRRISELEEQYNFHLNVIVEHMPLGQFTIQLEDATGNRTRLLSSEERDTRLPQSREGGRSGGRRRDRNRGGRGGKGGRDGQSHDFTREITQEMPDNGNVTEVFSEDDDNRGGGRDNNRRGGGRDRNKDRGGDRNRDRNRDGQNRGGDRNRYDRRPNENRPENPVEGQENAEGVENAEGGEFPQGEGNDNQRHGGRYEGRRGRRGRRGRGSNRNREFGDNQQQGDDTQIAGEPVAQYDNQQENRAPRAEVVELERKPQQSDDYPSDNESGDDGDKPRGDSRKGGWWKKIIE